MKALDVVSDDAVIAWRYWQVSPGSRVLRSVSQRRFEWQPHHPLKAFCFGGGHNAPAPLCNCGIYGALDLQTLRTHGLCLAPEVLVVGEVALWGRVLEHAEGWRAEFAYPRTLAVVDSLPDGERRAEIMQALELYGVPVSTISFDEALGDISAAVMAFQAMSRAVT